MVKRPHLSCLEYEVLMKQIFKDIWKNRRIIWQLAKNDCKARYAASGLGIVWAFLQPLLNVLVLWYVFQVGFKSMPVEGIPFIVWYIPAFLSWNFFQEAVSQSTNSLIEYSYLLKKVNFDATIIPLIKILSASIIHFGFIIFILIVNIIYGRTISVYFAQMLYYFLCAFALSASLGWLLSALAVFVKDIANVVSVILQIGFWATPLFWDPSNMDIRVQALLKWNPMYYVCVGYRESVISDICFWEHPVLTARFWILVVVIFICGTYIFKKLRPQFVDVL